MTKIVKFSTTVVRIALYAAAPRTARIDFAVYR